MKRVRFLSRRFEIKVYTIIRRWLRQEHIHTRMYREFYHVEELSHLLNVYSTDICSESSYICDDTTNFKRKTIIFFHTVTLDSTARAPYKLYTTSNFSWKLQVYTSFFLSTKNLIFSASQHEEFAVTFFTLLLLKGELLSAQLDRWASPGMVKCCTVLMSLRLISCNNQCQLPSGVVVKQRAQNH